MQKYLYEIDNFCLLRYPINGKMKGVSPMGQEETVWNKRSKILTKTEKMEYDEKEVDSPWAGPCHDRGTDPGSVCGKR